MPSNPLLNTIREAIEAQPTGISEYELMVKLQKNEATATYLDFYDIGDADSNLVLFRKHFLIMNALYQIQNVFFNEDRYLSISPLEIRVEPLQNFPASGLPVDSAESKIRDYYLDWNNIEVTAQADVDNLLTGFWQHFFAVDKRTEALKTLALPADAPLLTVKQAYRKLAHKYHPDKGGDGVRFRKIREAYEILLRAGLK